MTVDFDKVLILCNHHRRSLFFEASMRRLWNYGFKRILIQETGSGPFGFYCGPRSKTWSIGQKSFDNGMISLKQSVSVADDEIVFLVDSDCFVSDPAETDGFLQGFIKDGYDWASHLIGKDLYKESYIFSNGAIALVSDQSFIPSKRNIYPGFAPSPHYENCYTLISGKIWNRLSRDDVGHTRKMIRAIFSKGGKMGAHRADYRMRYSHFGPGWFHIGNLVAFYYALESRNLNKFSSDSEVAMSRLGYFLAQEDRYGKNIYPSSIRQALDLAVSAVGGEELPRKAWTKLTEGTCMESF